MATAKIAVRAATLGDVGYLRYRLRRSDIDEIIAATGKCPGEVLEMSYRASNKVWTGTRNGSPFVIFGVASMSLLSTTGSPWLLASDVFEKEGKAIGRASRYYVGEIRKGFLRLENYTDDRHLSAHRWLKWCGFSLEEPKPWGVAGLPFRRFTMEGTV